MKILLTIVLLLPAGLLQAQKISVGVEGYVGSFNMSSLKQYQSVSKDYYIPYKTVQNFPVQPGIRVVSSIEAFDKFSTGILLGMISTGSRLTYSDYTGSAYRDVIVYGYQFGSYNRYTFFSHKGLSFSARATFGGIYNTVKSDRRMSLVDSSYDTSDVSEWTSVNFYSDFGLEVGFTIGRFYFKGFSVYEFGIPSPLKRKNDTGSAQGQPALDVDWDGFRAGIGINYKFTKQE